MLTLVLMHVKKARVCRAAVGTRLGGETREGPRAYLGHGGMELNDYIVSRGKRFNVGGNVDANLIVEEGASALVGGDVLGNLIVSGELLLAGTVHGDLTIEETGQATIGGAIQGNRDIRGGIHFGGTI